MSPRAGLLTAATVAAWVALLTAAVTSESSPLFALAAGLVSLGVWHRLGRWASIAPAVGCVLLLVAGTSLVGAGVAGVLVLAHLVLVDLADDAHGSAALPVLRALLGMAPGALVGVAATMVVGTLTAIGAAVPFGPHSTALLLASPLVLLAAVLVALGMATRRRFWSYLVRPSQLSATTKRYLDRAGLRR